MKTSVKWLWIASGIFVLTFAWTCLTDYLKYNSTVNSAPYWAFVAARAIEFLIPALLFGVAALIVQRKN